MKKNKLVIVIIALIAFLGIMIGLNYEKIFQFFENKEWEIADSVASVSINNYTKVESTINDIILMGTNHLQSFSCEGKPKLDLFIPFQEVASCSAGDYCVIGEKNGNHLYLIMADQKQWESTINGTLYDVYVNKNGYVAVIYKQSGYKSLIKVLSPSGSELFTSYLASTYAVDVAITNDNKTLAIAEVDAEGIHVISSIKLIDINNPGNDKIQKIELEDNSLIVDIVYNEKNELLVRTDSSIEIIRANKREAVCSFQYADTLYATIENGNHAILVKKEENGLFDVKYQLIIYSSVEGMADYKQYELYDIPKQITSNGNTIAVVMDKEILFINTNAKLEKKINVSNNVKDIEILDNNMIGIVSRNKLEIVKL